jgi:hypothetical protein
MEYYKKVNDEVGITYFYAKDDLTLHIFGPSVTDPTKWNYTYQTGTTGMIAAILSGATGANSTELDPAINQIQTVLSGL